MLAMLALARCCLILFFGIVVLSRPVGLCNEPGPPVSLLGAVMGLAAIPKGCFTLARLLHVNCLPVTEFGPFRRLTAAVTVCWAAFLFWLFKFQAAVFLESWFLPFSYGFVFQMPPRRSTRNDLQPIPSFRVSWGFISSEEAYRGSQFTIQR